MLDLLNINNTAFTVMSYPMSYLELLGVIFNLACVILVARKNILTWPVGLIGAGLFITMFWQIQLYSDAILNGYFVITGIMGWVMWNRQAKEPAVKVQYGFSGRTTLIYTVLATLLLTLLWGSFMAQAHMLLPSVFTQPAAYPMWDAAILMASFIAQWLMMRKRTECWVYWIAVDLMAIALYWIKDIKFTSGLYVVFLGMATYGLIHWISSSKKAVR